MGFVQNYAGAARDAVNDPGFDRRVAGLAADQQQDAEGLRLRIPQQNAAVVERQVRIQARIMHTAELLHRDVNGEISFEQVFDLLSSSSWRGGFITFAAKLKSYEFDRAAFDKIPEQFFLPNEHKRFPEAMSQIFDPDSGPGERAKGLDELVGYTLPEEEEVKGHDYMQAHQLKQDEHYCSILLNMLGITVAQTGGYSEKTHQLLHIIHRLDRQLLPLFFKFCLKIPLIPGARKHVLEGNGFTRSFDANVRAWQKKFELLTRMPKNYKDLFNVSRLISHALKYTPVPRPVRNAVSTATYYGNTVRKTNKLLKAGLSGAKLSTLHPVVEGLNLALYKIINDHFLAQNGSRTTSTKILIARDWCPIVALIILGIPTFGMSWLFLLAILSGASENVYKVANNTVEEEALENGLRNTLDALRDNDHSQARQHINRLSRRHLTFYNQETQRNEVTKSLREGESTARQTLKTIDYRLKIKDWFTDKNYQHIIDKTAYNAGFVITSRNIPLHMAADVAAYRLASLYALGNDDFEHEKDQIIEYMRQNLSQDVVDKFTELCDNFRHKLGE